MPSTNPLMVNDACRLCDENKAKMYSIFAKSENGQQIFNLIKECLPLIIYRTDPLSKRICDECFRQLENMSQFKNSTLSVAERHKEHLCLNKFSANPSVQLFLSCNDIEMDKQPINIPSRNSIATSTDDLNFSCINCKSTNFNSSIIKNEVELCAELHKAISDSMTKNKVVTQSEPEKGNRTRRKRSQAFYHELDDSLCSSLTEFTNTESSQCYEEYHSEIESYETDSDDLDRVKRRKLSNSLINGKVSVENADQIIQNTCKELYKEEEEYRYFPLTLMSLALNVVNKHIVPDYEPDEFYIAQMEPICTYCKAKFKNLRLLALHEVEHINIELGEKVDCPSLWHESRDDAFVRNKWLNSFDEEPEDNDAVFGECILEKVVGCENLLIPVGTEIPKEHTSVGEIQFIDGRPTIDGISLTDYPKDERKTYYKTMRIGGINKKFCGLCRYSFKDNWAIESHYLSLACFYTCRYCGMRFNKQRQRFEEHCGEHEKRGDLLSTKIYAASKLSNFMPKIIQPDKVKKLMKEQDGEPEIKPPTIRVKNFGRKSLPANIKIKEEKMDSDDDLLAPPLLQKTQQGGTTKSPNQAYFCRKCYKVFFKLDEFNIHSKNCDYNQFPQNRKSTTKSTANGDLVSPTGRPMRHCVREAGPYRDEAYLPESALKETTASQQNFVCFICGTPFPTIYSRNSHMRIHKGDGNNTAPQNRQQLGLNPKPKQIVKEPQMYHQYVKQEPLEPEVEIHESDASFTTIGAVSITPISKNPNQKPTINPNIMKLVQNNPHLTIKPNQSPEQLPTPSVSHNMTNNYTDPDKSYKCSSCWEAFANKSHLYFHKKNQCEGSKYPCPFCKKRFGTEAAYSSHIFYSHPE